MLYKKMNETRFYDICDNAEAINENITNGYFPTKEEIEEHIKIYGLEDQAGILAYFASNPFKRQNNPAAELPEYQETVKFAKEMLEKIQLTEDEE